MINQEKQAEFPTMTVYGIVSDVASHLIREVQFSFLMKSVSRPTLYRIQSILSSLIHGERVTAGAMASFLEVSPRTIARDLDYLINSLHLPIAYDPKKKSYTLNGPIPVLFAPHISGLNTATDHGDYINVELEIDSEIADQFHLMELHPSQKIVDLEGGKIQLMLTVPITDVLVHWIISFGGKIRVIKPAHLRDKVHHVAMSIINGHRPRRT